jgi:septal ring factor EnvC (AmiA/AmiB activator)
MFSSTCGLAADEATKKADKSTVQMAQAPPIIDQLQQQKAALAFVIRGIELSKASIEDRLIAAKVELSQVEAQIAATAPKVEGSNLAPKK